MSVVARCLQNRAADAGLQIQAMDARPGYVELVSVGPAGGRSELGVGCRDGVVGVVDGHRVVGRVADQRG